MLVLFLIVAGYCFQSLCCAKLTVSLATVLFLTDIYESRESKKILITPLQDKCIGFRGNYGFNWK